MSAAPRHPETVGPYRLEDWIGSGGMGTVFRAWDERLERPVAVKHIQSAAVDHPTLRQRFLREARATARLNHPTIVHVYDILETDEGEWIVMELAEGRVLADLIEDSAPLPIDQTVDLAIAIARGLAEAHAKEIVHRDLKADNVMVSPAGEIKILDFGLAKPMSADILDTTLTEDGQIVGTALAMSPEQVMGLSVGPQSDLFSLGTLLYEMLTGRSPFKGETVFKTMDHVCCLDPPPVTESRPDAPHALSELVERLLAKDTAGRPKSAREVIASLKRLADARPSATLEAAGEEPARSDGSRGVPTAAQRVARPGAAAAAEPGVQRGERRQVTVVCFEVVGRPRGSAERFSALDPEALFELMPELRAVAGETIGRFEGSLGDLMGHRLWAYFGYPQAHEDSGERAVRAAFELGAELTRLGPGGTLELALRTAIHTGPAVVLGPAAGELALGSTLDLAMALHGLAEPGEVRVSEATHRRIVGLATSEALGPTPLPGLGQTLEAFRVLSVLDPSDPGAPGVTRAPLVARESELEHLLELWRRARRGTGQVVLISGETGIGKSRLVRALEERLAVDPVEWWTAHGRPYTRHSPLHPMTELLRRLLGFDDEADADAKLELLEEQLERHGFSPAEFVPLFASLLALPLSDRFSAVVSSPDLERDRGLKALGALLLEKAERRPAVLVVEDLQWLDPSSLELLDLMVRQVPAVPLLAVLTHRSGFEDPWRDATGMARIELGPLDAGQAAQLVEHLAAEGGLAPAVRREIVDKTDGVPLFVEELTKAVVEAKLQRRDGTDFATRSSIRVPATLQDSLTARLDRLGPAKGIAQEASVIGRDFTYDVLAEVSSAGQEDVRRGLEQLVASGLVQPMKGWRLRYIFQHALVRDAAYESLLAKKRRQIHHRVAELLENRSWSKTPAKPELLAHHYTEAGLDEPAARAWLEAGRRAMERSANREAIAHLQRGLEVAGRLPEGAERHPLELALLARLGPAQSVVHGYGAPDVERTYGRAHDLCRRFGSAPQVFWILWGLWAFHLVRSELERALELARKLIEIAEGEPGASGGDRVTWIVSSSSVALAHYFRGELREAREHLERATALDPAGRTTPLASATGQDAGVLARSLLALVRWHLGSPAEAVALAQDAVALAKRISHPYSLAYAEAYAARLHQSLRSPEPTREHAEAVIALSEERGFFWLSQGYFFRGCALAESRRQSREDKPLSATLDRVSHLQSRGLEAYRAGGARLSQTYMLAQMAESSLGAGQLDEARRFLDEASAFLVEGGERFWEGELRRLRGELELARNDPAAAREAMDDALAIARRRGDRAFELRAALSLGRLLSSQGRGGEAAALLGEVCPHFGDGVSFADLDEARELLARLSD